MKKSVFTFIISVVLLVFVNQAWAQVPQGFNYQAVARNSVGTLLQNQPLGVKLSIHQGSASGTVVYSEMHTPTTNAFGLFTVTVGQGTLLSGAFSTIMWSTGNYWLQVELDVTGGTTYTDMGTSQLLSVPYALYAEGTKAVPPGTSGQTLAHNGTGWTASDFLVNTGTRIGIGTNAPGGFLNINGNSTTTLPHVLLTENENDFSRLMFKTSTSSTKNWTFAAKTDATDANSQLNFNYHNGTTGSDLFTLTGEKKVILNGLLGIGMPPGNDIVEIFRDDLNYIRMYTTSSGTGSLQGFLTGISGVNTYLWNYENGSLQIGTNNMTRMVIQASGNVGIGDATPDATLDVEGTVSIGSGGVVFSEIKEITGTLDADGVHIFAYPSGYTSSNMRVLSLEINYNGTAWVGLSATDFPTTNVTKVFYYLTTQIYIYYPNVAGFQNRAFRMLVMKVQ